jgi:murein DD-endopeptidase MepM/ murein hydrolase activator NlpD
MNILMRIFVFFIFLIITWGIVYHYEEKIIMIKNTYEVTISDLSNDLNKERKDNKVKIEMIKSRVRMMNDVLKKSYPMYAYSEKVNDVVNNIDSEDFNKKLDELPIDLQRIYVREYLLKVHGLGKYKLTYPELGLPANSKKSYTPNFYSEFGTYRNYPQYYLRGQRSTYINGDYNGVHEGIDILGIDDMEILATYDAEVIRIYNWEGGLTVEIKYYNQIRKHWCLDRFLHCHVVNVKVGDKIKKGQIIAQYGNTGKYSTDDHIHYSHLVWNGKQWVHHNIFMNSTWGNRVYNYVLARF